MTPGREMTVSHNSRLTFALMSSIVAGVGWIAWSDAEWRTRSEMHYIHCEKRLDQIEQRLDKIEERMFAYESWPAAKR